MEIQEHLETLLDTLRCAPSTHTTLNSHTYATSDAASTPVKDCSTPLLPSIRAFLPTI